MSLVASFVTQRLAIELIFECLGEIAHLLYYSCPSRRSTLDGHADKTGPPCDEREGHPSRKSWKRRRESTSSKIRQLPGNRRGANAAYGSYLRCNDLHCCEEFLGRYRHQGEELGFEGVVCVIPDGDNRFIPLLFLYRSVIAGRLVVAAVLVFLL
jgi:hypothetical protein